MGVKNLSKFIKKYDVTFTMPFKDLKFKTIAIDTPILMYKYISVNANKINEPFYNKYEWVWSFIYFIHCLRENDITPVFILEGKAPEEKKEIQNIRKNQRKQIREKTIALEESLQVYKDTGNLDESLKTEMDKLFLIGNDDSLYMALYKHIQKRHRYDVEITIQDYKIFNILLKILGISYFKAPHEAEALCAYVKNKEWVDMIYSTDTDVLTYGCSDLIIDIDTSNKTFTVIDGKKLLKILDMNNDMFLDFCIMCGTDYNKNIPKIGIETAFKLIKQYKSIDNIPMNVDILNHNFIRNIFKNYSYTEDYEKFKDIRYGQAQLRLLTYLLTTLNINIDISYLTKGFHKTSIIF
ncbi:endonuclease [Spirochaetia bacterium]|nr:endonuclease [Spirochaetia bacterium]